MAYTKTNWLDRIVQFPRRYLKVNETSTNVTLERDPGAITQEGTPLNAANLNKIEQGIADAHNPINLLEWIKTVDGAGSGLDADTLDGYHASTPATANRVAVRDGNGYLIATRFHVEGLGTIPPMRANNGVVEWYDGSTWKAVGGMKRSYRSSFTNTTNTMQTALSVTSPTGGSVESLMLSFSQSSNYRVVVTIDGSVYADISGSSQVTQYYSAPRNVFQNTEDPYLVINFKSSLLVELQAHVIGTTTIQTLYSV